MAGVIAQAQIRKMFAERDSKLEGFASRLVPRPALLRQRLEQTGRSISLGKYALFCLGATIAISALLMTRGAPLMLAVFAGMFLGIGAPHFVVGRMIKRRIAKFTSNFPDAIDLMVRGLRSGLPITETLGIVSGEIPGPVGVEFRAVSDKMKIGRTMDAALQETADAWRRPSSSSSSSHWRSSARPAATRETLRTSPTCFAARQMKLKIRAMSSESKASAYTSERFRSRLHARLHHEPDLHGRFFTDPRLMVAGIGE